MKEFEELDFEHIQELIEQKDANAIKELLSDLTCGYRRTL